MRRTLALALLAVLLTPTSAVALTPTRIVDDRRIDETSPSLADGWTAWDANTYTQPNVFHGYVMADGGRIRKIPETSEVVMGNLITDGPHAGQLVYDARDTHHGDIRFYDLTSRQTSSAGTTVNTRRPEIEGSVSGDYLAFVRQRSDGQRDLLLYRFSSGRLKRFATGYYEMGQLNGDYVSYYACPTTKCQVYRYRISTGQSLRVPAAPSGRSNYWSAVGADGTVYYVQGSATKCGKNTKILAFAGGSTSTVLMVPDGVELATLQVDIVATATVIAFSEIDCAHSDWGAYRVTLP